MHPCFPISPLFPPNQATPAHFGVVPLKTLIRAGPKMLLSQTRRGCYRTHNSPLGQLIQKESQANNLSSCAKWPPGKTNNFQDTNSKSLLNPMEMNSPDYFTSTNPPNFKVPSTAEAGNNSCLKRGKNSARQFKTRKHIWEKSACPIRQVF